MAHPHTGAKIYKKNDMGKKTGEKCGNGEMKSEKYFAS
jgi:hypothetical protein